MRFCFRSAIKLLLNFQQYYLRTTWTVRETCAGAVFLVCLLIIPESATSKRPKCWPAQNGQTGAKSLSRLHSNTASVQPNRNHSDRPTLRSLLFHCINIHIDSTCNVGSIKWGAFWSQICQGYFELYATVRRQIALDAVFKIKSAKGLHNPDLFRSDLYLCVPVSSFVTYS